MAEWLAACPLWYSLPSPTSYSRGIAFASPSRPAQTVDELRQAAAAAVAALPGVVRLEPTLSNALRRLRAVTVDRVAASEQAAYSAADGIRLARHGTLIDIHVDVTVDTTQPANETAQAVHATLNEVITAHRLSAGEVTVTVLRLET